jgi:hypothetical protein
VTSNLLLAGEVQDNNDIIVGVCSTTAGTHPKNPLLDYDDEQAAAGLYNELQNPEKIQYADQVDASWVHQVYWVYTSWFDWITCSNNLTWDFDRLNKEQIERVGPMVEAIYAILEKRCGKRNANHPRDALNNAHDVVSKVFGNMVEAYKHLTKITSDSPATQDQQSATHDHFANMQQPAYQEQFNSVQQQTASDAEFAQNLEQQELADVEQQIDSPQYQQTTIASSSSNTAQSNIPNSQVGLQSNTTVPVPALGDWINPKQLDSSYYAQYTSPGTPTFPTSQQQPVATPFLSAQQASDSNATTQQSPRYPVSLLQKFGKTKRNNTGSERHNTNNAQTQLWTPRSVTEALSMKWTREDITPDEDHHPLPTSQNDEANLVLIRTWLEQNNDIVDGLRRWLKAPAITNEGETEQYKLLFGQEGVKPAIKQMFDRYLQIRDHACHRRGNTQIFDW